MWRPLPYSQVMKDGRKISKAVMRADHRCNYYGGLISILGSRLADMASAIMFDGRQSSGYGLICRKTSGNKVQ